MTTRRVIACVLAVSFAATANVWGAEKKAAVKKPVGRTETLTCKLGTEDRHARIAVVVIKGKTDSFAYYSKWKPRTCSIYLERNRDPYSKWADSGAITTVNLEKGAFMIEHKPGEYHFVFRDVDRERYCGMDGVINGTLTIKRGKNECELGGEIMAEGPPLGHVPAAYANMKAPAAGDDKKVADAAPAAEPKAAPAVAASTPAPAVETAAAKVEVQPAASGTETAATVAAKPETKVPADAAEPTAVAVAAEPPQTEAKTASTATAAAETDVKPTATTGGEATATRTAAAEAKPANESTAAAEPVKATTVAKAPAAPAQADAGSPGAVVGAQYTAAPDATGTTRTAAGEGSGGGPLKALFRFLSPAEPEQQAP